MKTPVETTIDMFGQQRPSTSFMAHHHWAHPRLVQKFQNLMGSNLRGGHRVTPVLRGGRQPQNRWQATAKCANPVKIL